MLKTEKKKVTIYTTSSFMGNVVKYEARLINHGLREYAQYKNAPYVDFILKGKRKTVRLQKSYKPYLLIVDGWNMPDPDSMLNDGLTKNGITLSKSRYRSFDERYKTDFDKIINKYKNDFIVDYRYIKVENKF